MTNTERALDQPKRVNGAGWWSDLKDNLLSTEEVVDYWVDKALGGTIDDIKTNADKVTALDTGMYLAPGVATVRLTVEVFLICRPFQQPDVIHFEALSGFEE